MKEKYKKKKIISIMLVVMMSVLVNSVEGAWCVAKDTDPNCSANTSLCNSKNELTGLVELNDCPMSTCTVSGINAVTCFCVPNNHISIKTNLPEFKVPYDPSQTNGIFIGDETTFFTNSYPSLCTLSCSVPGAGAIASIIVESSPFIIKGVQN